MGFGVEKVWNKSSVGLGQGDWSNFAVKMGRNLIEEGRITLWGLDKGSRDPVFAGVG